MVKKTFLYTLIALPVMAQAYGSFYLGVNGGVDTSVVQLNDTYPVLPTSNRVTDYMLFGGDWNGRAGYILPFHRNLFVDLNVITGFSNALASQRGGNIEFTYKKKYNWSMNAGIGLQRGRVSYEALLGFAEGKFQRFGESNTSPGLNFYRWTPGVQAGLEMGARLSPGLQLTATYLYDYFAKIRIPGSKTTAAGTERANYRFTEQRYLLGLNYYFSHLELNKLCNKSVMDPLGFYLGAAVGYDFTRINNVISTATDTERGLSGVIGGPYAGYSFYSSYRNHLNLAVEAFFNGTNSELHEERPYSSANSFYEKVDYNYGLTFNPGIFINKNYLFYGKFGGAYGRFIVGGPFPDRTNYAFSKTEPGYLLGMGVSVGLIDHLRARIEYDYSAYRSIKKRDINQLLYTFTPHMNDFMFGLSYYI